MSFHSVRPRYTAATIKYGTVGVKIGEEGYDPRVLSVEIEAENLHGWGEVDGGLRSIVLNAYGRCQRWAPPMRYYRNSNPMLL